MARGTPLIEMSFRASLTSTGSAPTINDVLAQMRCRRSSAGCSRVFSTVVLTAYIGEQDLRSGAGIARWLAPKNGAAL